MISVILYGRNDSYGYNLHKRAALSFNCIAETLTGADDEILFVDYNTPDDYPTFPEAIQDTLTLKAKAKLRILRARSFIHARYAAGTHLMALEPIARNIAIRRSNPANRWVLSTNTDMIFVPRKSDSLTDRLAGLPDGHYGTARLEIPESLWESFDRLAPERAIAFLRDWAPSMYLNEVVYGSHHILFDAPGDFQLLLRTDLFALHGFDERMILGWHVDSNLCRRANLLRGPVKSALSEVFAYHCDHTRQVTPMHRAGRIENDARIYIDSVEEPVLTSQAGSWGCADDSIEELRLDTSRIRRFISVLEATVAPASQSHHESMYGEANFANYHYVPEHVLAFLVDLFIDLPRQARLAWCGVRRDLFDLVVKAWSECGFKTRIVLDEASRYLAVDRTDVDVVDHAEWIQLADIFMFEFGVKAHDGSRDIDPRKPARLSLSDDSHLARVRKSFLDATMAERDRLKHSAGTPRRFVGINCIHNPMEALVHQNVGITYTPYSSRVRSGFVIPMAEEQLHRLIAGDAGVRDQRGLRADPKRQGYIFFGPYVYLPAGPYKVKIDIEIERRPSLFERHPLGFECVMGNTILARRYVLPRLGRKVVELSVNVTDEAVSKSDSPLFETRCFSHGGASLVVRSCMIQRMDA